MTTPQDAASRTDDTAAAPPPSQARPLAALAAWSRVSIRAGEGGLILLATFVGIASGLLTTGLSRSAALLHQLLFGVPGGALSALEALPTPWLAAVPAAGGVVVGLSTVFIRQWRPGRPVDAIEANALQGGRMSVLDSLLIGLQTVLSSGCGASVGLEAGYTQLGGGFASWVGRRFSLRRADLRMLVGAGAGAAIAAAFGGPLTGTFYAFEIIIGTYTPIGLAPVITASIAAVLTARAVGGGEPFLGTLNSDVALQADSIAALILLSLVCAALGVAVMRGVTLVDATFKKSRLPTFLQPAVGGLALGAMALVTPHVLSAGHSALAKLLQEERPALAVLAITLGLKCLASAVSIGSGFRGGLFFASLYLGGLTGMLFYAVALRIGPSLPLDGTNCAIVGMAAMSVTIIGGPLTMSFLALETTGDFTLSIVILAAAALVSVLVRRTFGYSFATWRLHLRGESIRSAQDVGWIRSLTVRRLMRHDVDTVFADTSISSFLENYPAGSGYWFPATDPYDRYVGLISSNDAYALPEKSERRRQPLSILLRYRETVLTPEMNIQEAARVFEKCEAEALAVVESTTDRRVIGVLSEAHALRRYTEELDKVRKDLSGESWVDGREA